MMRATYKSALIRNYKKVLNWPWNKDFVEPIEKMKILVCLAITAFCQSGLQIFSLKKSVNVANFKRNIFPKEASSDSRRINH